MLTILVAMQMHRCAICCTLPIIHIQGLYKKQVDATILGKKCLHFITLMVMAAIVESITLLCSSVKNKKG